METPNIEQLQQVAERNARELLPAFIPISRVLKIAGFCKNTIRKMQKAGDFPMPAISSGNCVRYDLSEILEWRRLILAKRDQKAKHG